MLKSRIFQAHLALLLANLIYGANYTIAKDVMPAYILPSGFILLRVLVATLLFTMVNIVWVKEKIKVFDFPLILVCGLTGVTINQLFFFEGLALTSPINAALIMTTNPILVLVMAALIIREKITVIKTTGIVAGLTGAIVLILYNNDGAATGDITGDIFIFLNAMSYGVYLVLVKPLMKKYNPVTVMLWVFFTGTIAVIPFGYRELAVVDWSAFTPYIWTAVIYVVVATTFLAYLLNTVALKNVSASVVSFYVYLQPLFATLISVATGKAHFNLIHIISAALIFTGVYLVSSPQLLRKRIYPEK